MATQLESRSVPGGDPAGRAFREARIAILPLTRRVRSVFSGRTVVDSSGVSTVSSRATSARARRLSAPAGGSGRQGARVA